MAEPGLDTIDIEQFAGKVKTGIVTFFTSFIYAQVVVIMPKAIIMIFGTPIQDAIRWAVDLCAGRGGLTAFFINTKVFTADQAKDYVATIDKLEGLPDDVSDDEWEAAERAANHAFANLYNFKR